MNKKVLVGMSGGVDSSVAAVLLKNAGYEVAGVTLRLHDENLISADGKCGSKKDVADAAAVCEKLGIEHYVCEYKSEFETEVMKRFVSEYKNGLTPNPCIDCNRFIKFPKLLETADSLGFDFIATGHYAKRVFLKDTKRFSLASPSDKGKDQTYVLYSLSQEILSRLLLPLAEYEKAEIRKIAEENGLVNSHKKDSQDICFVPDKDYAGFIKRYSGYEPIVGDYISVDGKKLGKHSGIINYTIGQRKGLGIAFGKPQFVISKSVSDNSVTLGDEEYLFKNSVTVGNVNFVSIPDLGGRVKCKAKIRYSQSAVDAVINKNDNGTLTAVFSNAQRAVTPGQAAVFFKDDVLLCGGTIIE